MPASVQLRITEGIAKGKVFPIVCKVRGTAVDGNNIWYALPPTLGEWVSAGAGREYDGYLISDGKTVEAWNGRSEENEIQH